MGDRDARQSIRLEPSRRDHPFPFVNSIATMSLLETRPAPSELELDARKRLMLFSGRANPNLAARIASRSRSFSSSR